MNTEWISELTGNEKRMRMLRYILFSGKELKVSRASQETGLSKGFVSSYFKKAADAGLLSGKGTYTLSESAVTRSLRILLNSATLGTLQMEGFGIEGAGVYGSWARGTNTEESDIDIWIFSKERKGQDELAEIEGYLRRATGCEIDLLPINRDNMKEIKGNLRLSCALQEGMTIYGRGFDELEGMY